MNFSGKLAQGLVDEIIAVVHKYDDTLLLPTALGCLDIAKMVLLEESIEEDDEDEH
jgi:hypothetical protein